MSRRALCLVNLGTPTELTLKGVRKYLREFLMDPFVLTVPLAKRFWIVHAFVLPFRTKRSLEAYQAIWTEEGSPLLVHMNQLAEKLRQRLHCPVEVAMRYGRPSIPDALGKLRQQEVDEVYFYPLYPHYALSTTQTAIEEARRYLKHHKAFSIRVLSPYYSDPAYEDLLARHIQKHLSEEEYLLLSFHSLPTKHITHCDPTGSHCLRREDCCEQPPSDVKNTCYRAQVLHTVNSLQKKLARPQEKLGFVFQSKFGRGEWLEPLLEDELPKLPEQGVERLAVACPGFSVDCLETLEEVGLRGKEQFLEHGGQSFRLIPCLNAEPEWADLLAQWFEEGRGIPLEELKPVKPKI